jgi:ABC-2 type transport system permease protein
MFSRSQLPAVAWWEFRRFLRGKDLLLTVVFVIAAAFGVRLIGGLMANAEVSTLNIAATPAELLPLAPGEYGRFVVQVPDATEEVLRERLENKEIDAVLVLTSREDGRLVVRSGAAWQSAFLTLLSGARQDERLAESGVTAEQLGELTRPMAVELSLADEDKAAGRPGRVGAGIMIGLMLFGILIGNSYLLVGITGEKNQRVTEQIMAAISPQVWIDGKIVGLSGLVVVNLLLYVLGYVLYKVGAMLFLGDPLGFPRMISDPFLFLAVLVLALLGFVLWFSFFALVASTINDPNTSMRSIFIMLPFLPLAIAFGALGNPDAAWLQTFGVIPFTSPTVLSARLVLGEVAPWEFPVAVALLVATIWFLRRAAGKIFGLGMLMYGKEPKWSELVRWAREAG